MGYISLIAMLILGLAMTWRPKLLWKIENMFSVKGGEPTELYLIFMRLGGVFITLTAVIMAFSLIF